MKNRDKLMSKDKPVLTLSFNKNSMEADKLYKHMQQRVKQLGIIFPSTKEKNNTINSELLIKKEKNQINKHLSKTVIEQSKAEFSKTDTDKNIKFEDKIVEQSTTSTKSKKCNLTRLKDDSFIISKNAKQQAQQKNLKENIKVTHSNKISKHESPKIKWLIAPEKVEKLLQYLRDTYPHCFTIPISPLALKIHKQLWENELNKEDSLFKNKTIIRNILQVYVRGSKYRQSLVLGVPRLNLDGTSGSNVTEAELPINYRKKIFKEPNTESNNVNALDYSNNSK